MGGVINKGNTKIHFVYFRLHIYKNNKFYFKNRIVQLNQFKLNDIDK